MSFAPSREGGPCPTTQKRQTTSAFRFTLRSLLLVVGVTAIVSALVKHHYFRPDPISYIDTRSEWDTTIDEGRHIVFVDGDWNIEMAAFRNPFSRFAEWCQQHTDIRAVTMIIDPGDRTNDVWNICQQLWRTNNINAGGMKHLGGAGRVLWVEDGQVVDYAWCVEVTDYGDLQGIETLKARTQKAFN